MDLDDKIFEQYCSDSENKYFSQFKKTRRDGNFRKPFALSLRRQEWAREDVINHLIFQVDAEELVIGESIL